MLRDNYKKAFSQIDPSEETIERIFEMTEKKHIKKVYKGLIIAVAVIATLLCGALTANAATDGALFEGISRIVSGEKVNLKDYIVNYDSYVDEDGANVEKYEFDIEGEAFAYEVKSTADEDPEVTVYVELEVDCVTNDDGSVEYEMGLSELAEQVISAMP